MVVVFVVEDAEASSALYTSSRIDEAVAEYLKNRTADVVPASRRRPTEGPEITNRRPTLGSEAEDRRVTEETKEVEKRPSEVQIERPSDDSEVSLDLSTDLRNLLRTCGQREPLDFQCFFSEEDLESARKIGEGAFGEVSLIYCPYVYN